MAAKMRPCTRLGEMLGLQELGDPVKGRVVDEDRAEQRLLGLDIGGRRAIGRVAFAQRRDFRERGFCHDDDASIRRAARVRSNPMHRLWNAVIEFALSAARSAGDRRGVAALPIGDVVARQRHGVDALASCIWNTMWPWWRKAISDAGEIEFPHAAEALVVERADALAVGEEAQRATPSSVSA